MPALTSNKLVISNDNLRIHFVNVDHGDAIILEFPDYQDYTRRDIDFAHYAVVDAGRTGDTKDWLSKYLRSLVKFRNMEYCIDFVCITHPHDDHYGGLTPLLTEFDGEIRQFWDCGFRTTTVNYNKILEKIADDNRILFLRPVAGMEFEFGKVKIYTLGPSLDLRNRFDTYGINRNNASIVLKIQLDNSAAILSGDAQFDSWGKIAEEFPRTTKITYSTNASVSRSEGNNQLKCQLLKVSHHGSKHGTTLECLEKLNPSHFMITCAEKDWYAIHEPGWHNIWPHDLTALAIKEISNTADVKYSYKDKNVIYRMNGTNHLQVRCFSDNPDCATFPSHLETTLLGW